MDNAQIQKYINNIVGGCNCPLQEDEAQTLQFKDTDDNNYFTGGGDFDVLKFISDSISSSKKYAPTKFMDDYVNMNYDRLQFFGGKRNSKKKSKTTNKKTSAKNKKGGDNIEDHEQSQNN